MSRRIPGRKPALVGSAPLRSCPDAPTPLRATPTVSTTVGPTADESAPALSLTGPASGTAHMKTIPSVAGGAASLSVAPTPPRDEEAVHPELVSAEPVAGVASTSTSVTRSLKPVADPPQAEVDQLWSAFLAAPSRALRDRLVVHYTPLVRSVAHRVAAGLPSYVETADLVQAGTFGLIEAVLRFDPVRCARFESYAAQRIRGAILDELRAQDWVPRSVRGRTRELERAQERLEGRLLRGATDRELAAELGVSVRDLAGLSRQVQLVSVEALHESSGGVSELLADNDAPDPMAVVQAQETLRQLSVAVGQLGERDQTVIRLYYLENRTLAEIGLLLGVTESRVCQLHTRLVGRLRGRMEELAAG